MVSHFHFLSCRPTFWRATQIYFLISMNRFLFLNYSFSILFYSFYIDWNVSTPLSTARKERNAFGGRCFRSLGFSAWFLSPQCQVWCFWSSPSSAVPSGPLLSPLNPRGPQEFPPVASTEARFHLSSSPRERMQTGALWEPRLLAAGPPIRRNLCWRMKRLATTQERGPNNNKPRYTHGITIWPCMARRSPRASGPHPGVSRAGTILPAEPPMLGGAILWGAEGDSSHKGTRLCVSLQVHSTQESLLQFNQNVL